MKNIFHVKIFETAKSLNWIEVKPESGSALKTIMRIPQPDVDPDPTFHPDADPDPSFKKEALEKVLK